MLGYNVDNSIRKFFWGVSMNNNHTIDTKTHNVGLNHKKILIIVFFVMIAWFLFAIFFVDNRWWYSIGLVVAMGYLVLLKHQADWKTNNILKHQIQHFLKLSSFLISIFVVSCALWITPLWWLGLLIVVSLFGASQIIKVSRGEIGVTPIPTRKATSISIILFMLLLLLFFVPSLVANSSKNPKSSFSKNYHAVQSYSIYGDGKRNQEHVYAKSWYTNPNHFVNDYVNVIFANEVANSARGNLPFGIVRKIKVNEVYDQGILVGYKDGNHFMPLDEYKGDVARIMLYMHVTYKDDGIEKSKIDVGLMKSWSRQDPVDARERERNNTIYDIHMYRNRFVSLPWLVGFIV